jgi:DNA-binding MarR family transcriptional regulator
MSNEGSEEKRRRKPRLAVRASRPSRDSPSLTSVGFLLHLALCRFGERVARALEGTGLHPGHLGVLGALTDRGGMSQRRLCDITQIEKSSMVLFLDTLEAGGWVRRARDPEDRRAHIVEMSDEGAARFATLGISMQAIQDAFLAPLAEKEREQLVDLLIRVTSEANEE